MRDSVKFDFLEKSIRGSEYNIECEGEYKLFVKSIAHRLIEEKKKIIYFCGQSSSGKTTTTLRLKSYLERLGNTVHLIELDDYFLPKAQSKINKKGEMDFETIFALDLPAIYALKKDMDAGKPVILPDFDFVNEVHSEGKEFILKKDDIIIIEGIHAFNSRILNTFGTESALKVFITVNTDIDFGDTVLRANDLRFIRRLVRDFKYRNSDPDYTIKLWKLVRAGEKRYAGGYIKKADIFRNTFLNYEPYVLVRDAIPLLKNGIETSMDTAYFKILLNKVQRFSEIENVEVPVQSILNEFI